MNALLLLCNVLHINDQLRNILLILKGNSVTRTDGEIRLVI